MVSPTTPKILWAELRCSEGPIGDGRGNSHLLGLTGAKIGANWLLKETKMEGREVGVS